MSVRIPEELKARLDRLASATGRPVTFYIREALAEHIDDLEWAYGIATLAEQSRAGVTSPRPIEDLLNELGLTRDEVLATPTE